MGTGQVLYVMQESLLLFSPSRSYLKKKAFQSPQKKLGDPWEFIREFTYRRCNLPSVTERWTCKHGVPPTTEDAERIYTKSLSVTLDVLPANSKMIKGVTETVEKLRKQYGLKIGSSTGYTSEIME